MVQFHNRTISQSRREARRKRKMRKLHVAHGTFTRVTFALHMCDMILGKRISGRKYIYSLKDVA